MISKAFTEPDYRSMILAYLHDPPDKSLNIKEHEARARKIASLVLDDDITSADLAVGRSEDIKASVEDRLPLPKYDIITGKGIVDFCSEKGEGNAFRIHHPLSGCVKIFDAVSGWKPDLTTDSEVQRFLDQIAKLDEPAKLFALWRFMPDMMAEKNQSIRLLPADTRVPDHTIWNHLDLTVAFKAALADNEGGALLSFTIGPVQEFIEQARSLRDLWSGSYILSWLAFHAMLPIVKTCGPSSVIFPGLRGNALFDWWMKNEFKQNVPYNKLLLSEDKEDLLIGSLPNTFIALVPHSTGKALAASAEQSCRDAWLEMAEQVREKLKEKWSGKDDWDAGWTEQIAGFWDIHTVVLPLRLQQQTTRETLKSHFEEYLWKGCWPNSSVLALEESIREAKDDYGARSHPPGSWAMHVELSQRLMAAARQIRHIPPHTAIGGDRPKCTLMGSFEQMGPGDTEKAQREFWEFASATKIKGTHIRKSERLCAVSLVKRFCWPALFSTKLGFKPQELRYSDTATIAAREWLKDNNIDPVQIRKDHEEWNGQWIFQRPDSWTEQTKDNDRDPPPPPEVQLLLSKAKSRKDLNPPRSYYSVFVMDGDEMGKWLRGEYAPKLREAYHPKLTKYFEEMDRNAIKTLDDKRPLSPALHAALTQALGNFARYIVREIVEKHDGELVYAGGDDVLALTPTDKAISALFMLREQYRQDWQEHKGRLLTFMGSKATVSAGLAVAHYKSDLRDAVEAARNAEKAAKKAGRDALGISILKRSGEHSTLVCPWEFVHRIEQLVTAFSSGASDRFAYRLCRESEVLRDLPNEAIASVIKQTVNHGEKSTRDILFDKLNAVHSIDDDDADDDDAGQAVASLFDEFQEVCFTVPSKEHREHREKYFTKQRLLTEFLTLIQSASFLARGRDD